MRELSFHEQQIDIPFLRVLMYSIIESLTWYVNSIQEMGSKATTFPSNFSLLILLWRAVSEAKGSRYLKKEL